MRVPAAGGVLRRLAAGGAVAALVALACGALAAAWPDEREMTKRRLEAENLPLFRADDPLPFTLRADFSKINRVMPAFKPAWDARLGAKQLYEAYTRIGIKLEDFEGPRYKRIDHIKLLLSSGRLSTDLRWTSPDHAVNVVPATA